MQLPEGKAFLAEGTACVNAFRQEHMLYIQGVAWKPVCLDRVSGEENNRR